MKFYAVREQNGTLYLYEYNDKPHKEGGEWVSKRGSITWVSHDDLEEVKWEDTEPTKVELVIKK